MPSLSTDLEKALNHHVTEELAASHWYLSASAVFHEAGLVGMAKWMMVQSDEERQHAMRFVTHIQQRHGHVRLEQIPAPRVGDKSARDTFEDAMKVEVGTTARIHKLHAQATKHGDVALRLFLDWFVQEQLEEEDMLRTALDRFTLAGDDRAALLLLDREFGARVIAPKKE
jgi:ferritin